MSGFKPTEALHYYRALAPDLVQEAGAELLKLSADDRMELMFYMTFYNTQLIRKICDKIGIDTPSLGEAVENLKSQ